MPPISPRPGTNPESIGSDQGARPIAHANTDHPHCGGPPGRAAARTIDRGSDATATAPGDQPPGVRRSIGRESQGDQSVGHAGLLRVPPGRRRPTREGVGEEIARPVRRRNGEIEGGVRGRRRRSASPRRQPGRPRTRRPPPATAESRREARRGWDRLPAVADLGTEPPPGPMTIVNRSVSRLDLGRAGQAEARSRANEQRAPEPFADEPPAIGSGAGRRGSTGPGSAKSRSTRAPRRDVELAEAGRRAPRRRPQSAKTRNVASRHLPDLAASIDPRARSRGRIGGGDQDAVPRPGRGRRGRSGSTAPDPIAPAKALRVTPGREARVDQAAGRRVDDDPGLGPAVVVRELPARGRRRDGPAGDLESVCWSDR